MACFVIRTDTDLLDVVRQVLLHEMACMPCYKRLSCYLLVWSCLSKFLNLVSPNNCFKSKAQNCVLLNSAFEMPNLPLRTLTKPNIQNALSMRTV